MNTRRKRTTTLLVLLAVYSAHLASQTDSIHTIFRNGVVSQHFFIEPEFKTHLHSSRFSEPASLLIGGKLGWTFNSHLMFAFCGYGKTTPTTYYGPYTYKDKVTGEEVTVAHQKMRTGYGYGGIAVGVILNPYNAVHLAFGSVLAGGSSNEYIIQDNGSHGTTFGSPGFFIMEPSLNMEMNLTKKMRLEAGAGYRYIFAGYFKSLSSSDLSGLSFNLGLKLGAF